MRAQSQPPRVSPSRVIRERWPRQRIGLRGSALGCRNGSVGELSRKMARAFDLWDSHTPFLRYESGEDAAPVTRRELAVFGLAVRQALVDLAIGIEKLDPEKLAGDPITPPQE